MPSFTSDIYVPTGSARGRRRCGCHSGRIPFMKCRVALSRPAVVSKLSTQCHPFACGIAASFRISSAPIPAIFFAARVGVNRFNSRVPDQSAWPRLLWIAKRRAWIDYRRNSLGKHSCRAGEMTELLAFGRKIVSGMSTDRNIGAQALDNFNSR